MTQHLRRAPFFISFLLALAIAGAAVPFARAQGHIVVDKNQQLFAVMCALHAAGYEADLPTVGFHPVRARLRGQLLRLQGPAVEELRKFYKGHLLADPAATLSRYVSFALVVGPPPKFDFLLSREQLPPDALALEGFHDLLVDFYREAQVDRLWLRVQADYDREIARFREPVSQIVLTSSAYLREILSPASRRTFSIYVEPMVGPRTNFRSYADRYSIVLTPSRELPVNEIRHAFLHFLIDPVPPRFPLEVEDKRALLNYAARAPRLPVEFKDDFTALVTECLVRAVELRLKKLPPVRLAAALDEAEGQGYVLVQALHRELEKFEKSEPAMTYFFPDIMRGIDTAEEARRLEKVNFAAAPVLAEETAHERTQPEPSELERWLVQAEHYIAEENAQAAAAQFERVLAKYPGTPRALYGLAVAMILRGEGERAKQLLQQIISSVPRQAAGSETPRLLAWSHVYLGRIYDVEGNRDLALSEYRAALAVAGAPDAARLAAQRGIDKGYVPVKTNRDAVPQRP